MTTAQPEPPDDTAPPQPADNPETDTETDAAYAEALRVLHAEIAELRAQGIITGGEGPRDALLTPGKHIPGALARFLASRGF